MLTSLSSNNELETIQLSLSSSLVYTTTLNYTKMFDQSAKKPKTRKLEPTISFPTRLFRMEGVQHYGRLDFKVMLELQCSASIF